MARYKKMVLLHSNDMHGDFLEEQVDETLVGGVSLLSGYVAKVRREEANTLYCVAGDMFRGSVIDSEYRGMSTIEIMNALSPDVVTLGNHETDYGMAHMLFLEKCARFPIINANLYVKSNGARLFRPCWIQKIGGMKVLFIGILTEDVIAQTKKEELIGSVVGIRDAAEEVRRICSAYQTTDVDLTVLLTHIGFEEDKKLAAELDPALGVDIIIGGHSHTIPAEPAVVNDILIVQAGTGTDQIGRFDLTIDCQENKVADWAWEIVPIDEAHCPRDPAMEHLLAGYKSDVDRKYNRVVTRFRRELTHPVRHEETALGNLLADALRDALGLDLVMLASGSIRAKSLGALVLYADLSACFSFDDKVYMVTATGAQLRRMLTYMLRDETLEGAHTEFYQLSAGMHLVYDRAARRITTLTLKGEEVKDDGQYTVGFQEYHFLNVEANLAVSIEELSSIRKPRVVAASAREVVDEYLTEHQHLDSRVEGRIVVS